MKKLLATFVIVSLFGCYNNFQVPVEELYRLNIGGGTDTHLRDSTGEEVPVSARSELTFETTDGQRTKLQLTRAQVDGNILSGRVRSGQPVQIELPQIQQVGVRNFAVGKTVGLTVGLAVGVLAAIIIPIVVIAATSTSSVSSVDGF